MSSNRLFPNVAFLSVAKHFFSTLDKVNQSSGYFEEGLLPVTTDLSNRSAFDPVSIPCTGLISLTSMKIAVELLLFQGPLRNRSINMGFYVDYISHPVLSFYLFLSLPEGQQTCDWLVSMYKDHLVHG